LRDFIFAQHPRFIDGIFQRSLIFTANRYSDQFSDVYYQQLLNQQEEIRAAIYDMTSELINEIPNKTEREIIVELQRIFARLKDNHSIFLDFQELKLEEAYPLRFKLLGDELYLVASSEEFSAFLGYRLISVNNVAIEDIATKYLRYGNIENIYATKPGVEMFISSPIMLEVLKVADSDENTFTLLSKDGNEVDLTPQVLQNEEEEFVFIRDRQLLLRNQNADKVKWFVLLEDEEILYIRFNQFHREEGISLRREVANFLETNENNISAAIIDARYNPGGFQQYTMSVFYHLNNNIPADRIFYFMNESSTSGSTLAAGFMYMRGATIIGRPSGQGITFFVGGIPDLELNYSELRFTVSSGVRSTWEHGYHADDNIIRPHVLINYTLDDWVNARDLSLEYVINLLKYNN